MNIWLLFLLLIVLLISYNYVEMFDYNYNLDSVTGNRILGINKYVRLNKFNRIDNTTISPPLPRIGEKSCDVTSCPNWIPNDAICYKCA
jgi:hypothetical protein